MPGAHCFHLPQTLLLRPSTLSWWGDFEAGRPREVGDLVEAVEARFNRLVVFDPRVPHGVARVQASGGGDTLWKRVQADAGCHKYASLTHFMVDSITRVSSRPYLSPGHPRPPRGPPGHPWVV